MLGLAEAIERRGWKVFFVAEQTISSQRMNSGWLGKGSLTVNVQLVRTSIEICEILKEQQSIGAIHVCQGLRGNGMVAQAYRLLLAHGQRPWIIMETVDDRGVFGFAKRLTYRVLLTRLAKSSAGILAIGYRTSAWLTSLGYPKDRIFEFTYYIYPRF